MLHVLNWLAFLNIFELINYLIIVFYFYVKFKKKKQQVFIISLINLHQQKYLIINFERSLTINNGN